MANYTYSLPVEAGYNVTQGVDRYFSWITSQEPTFGNYFILMIWAVIFMGGTFTERKLNNKEDFIKWAFLASFISFGISLIFTFTTDFNVNTAFLVSLASLILFGILEFKDFKAI